MTEDPIHSGIKKAAAKPLKGEPEATLIQFREQLDQEPRPIQAFHHTGVMHYAAGRHIEALICFQKALALKPDDPDILNDLALTHKRMQQIPAALAALEKALSIAPRQGRLHYNLANLLRETGQDQQAVKHYLKAIEMNPRDHEAYKNIGIAYLHLGQLTQAREACRHSLSLLPGQAGVYHNLGLIEMAAQAWDQAREAFTSAIQYNPGFTEAWLNLGLVRQKLGESEQAVACLEKALELDPAMADAYYNLGLVYETTGQIEKELEIQKKALWACPDHVQTWIGAMRVFSKVADWPRLEASFARTLAYAFSAAEETLLSTALYLFHVFPFSGALLDEKHSQWGAYALQKQTKRHSGLVFDFQSLKTASPKIRIGYVSPDFRRHSVGWFFKTLAQYHDPQNFDIYCYAVDQREDDLTRQIAQNVTRFIRTSGWNTRTLAQAVHRDQIQILVDLAGHTRGHRLDVFCLKPAPIQVTAFGYPNATGLATMDYRITDHLAEGPPTREYDREKPVRLSRFFLPLGPLPVSPGPLTRPEGGFPLQGTLLISFNRPGKLRPELLHLWDRILAQCPEALLAVGCPFSRQPELQTNLLSYFSSTQTRSRVFFLERAKNEEEHRARYGLADLALDSFPYSGTTTSYEALYMDVPVITLAGDRHVQRTTYSLLKHIGLEETLAYSEEEYVAKAVELIRAPRRLKDLKTKLQKAMQKTRAAPADYVKELEEAYRIMWRRFQNNEPIREINF